MYKKDMVDDIKDDEMLSFIEKYDSGSFDELVGITFNDGPCPLTDMTEDEKDCVYEILDNWLTDGDRTKAGYIADVINDCEIREGRMQSGSLVESYDDFVYFNVLRFPEDEPERCARVRTKDDFIKIIDGYFPVSQIRFDNIYCGSDWIDSYVGFD